VQDFHGDAAAAFAVFDAADSVDAAALALLASKRRYSAT
jgi:hypothetical protein